MLTTGDAAPKLPLTRSGRGRVPMAAVFSTFGIVVSPVFVTSDVWNQPNMAYDQWLVQTAQREGVQMSLETSGL